MAVAPLITAALVLICYGFALRLPFFYDDLPIMTWLGRHRWLDIWTMSSEVGFFRPLTFTVYKLGRLLPPGVSQGVLHATSLLLHWISSILVMQIVALRGRAPGEALLASVLFAVFPFVSLAIPWITAMPHLLVTMLTLLAVLAALKVERDRPLWWWVSLLAMALAPLAHESGVMCAAIVAGVTVIHHGLRGHKGTVPIVLGTLLNVGAVVIRGAVPGVREASVVGPQDWLKNAMFFLHGLVYPLAPVIGWLVQHAGAHDFTLVAIAATGVLAVVVWTMRRRRDWRHGADSLWWWACAALPAAASLQYGYLYSAPRVHALSAGGLVMLWAGLILEPGRAVRGRWRRVLVSTALVGLVVIQNLTFLRRQRALFGLISGVYQRVISAAEDRSHAPLGFVNLPRGVGRRERTYAMVHESITFLPSYSNIAEFIEVNRMRRPADAVMYAPVLKEPDIAFSFQGEGLTWEEMRQFALDHRTIWLSRWRDGGFTLRHVGTVEPGAVSSMEAGLVRFDDGPRITAVSVEPTGDDRWAVVIDWAAAGPVDARVFVHVRGPVGNVVTQADGPALGGMVPTWTWRPGDRIHDVRHISVHGDPPYTVQVGLFNEGGRYAAYLNGIRCPDDACSVATFGP